MTDHTEEQQQADQAAEEQQQAEETSAEDFFRNELPPVTESAGDFEGEPESQSESEPEGAHTTGPEDYRGTLDDKGKPYDPAIHAFPPEKTATGRWRKKPRKQIKQDEIEGEANAGYRREAEKLARLYAMLHEIPFGQDGRPESVDDLLPLIDSWERYMLEHGKKEIPAGIDLFLTSGMYTYAIASREPNRLRLREWFAAILDWIIPGRKKRRETKEKEDTK